ncbi:Zn-ribbon domain-containing OB-fold protein [Haloglomus litoreum]|uniref:Zn-ribbon domain-containing OB-fold protein n=1 Tax=Haloglomus litoreum TaxID=3034026 RepID=UPI0023E80A47|nr:zinc ribbon domain-containing protein [Haloglomus sp. DT116]
MTADEVPAYAEGTGLAHATWARALRDGVLLGQECSDCEHVLGTPKSVCPACSGRSLVTVRLPTSGEVFSETTIEVTPEGLDDRYQVAVVDLGPTRLLARVADEVEIGDPVVFDGFVQYEDLPGPRFVAEPTG